MEFKSEMDGMNSTQSLFGEGGKMTPDESPFPPQWIGICLENAGLGKVRPRIGTYGRYDFNLLPPAPTELRGDWGWLHAEPERLPGIGGQSEPEATATADALRASAARAGLPLPHAFVSFIETPALHRRVRSNTDCSLDISREVVPAPAGGGFLVRFLADSQGCVFWYLYLTPGGSDHAVVSSPDFYGTAEEMEGWGEEPRGLSRIAFAAESFEAFMWRFWLENEMWFAGYEDTPMPAAGTRYAEQYLARAADAEPLYVPERLRGVPFAQSKS